MKNKSAIMQMYFGKRGNTETIPMSDEYKTVLSKLVTLDEEMTKKLKENSELLELYKKIIEVEMELEAETSDTHFYEGFSFGLLIGVEAGMR